MLLTKYTHACVRIENEGRALVLDPGTFSETDLALAGADAVLITHEHADHIDQDAVLAALAANPGLSVHAPAVVADALRAAAPRAAGQVHAAAAGDAFTAAGFAIRCFGGQHALIHAAVPVVANVGYLVDDAVYHPGDSLIVPPGVQVDTLLVPVHAPWSKVAEVVDFVVSVRAPRAFQIHDALLNEAGLGFTEAHIARIGAQHGTDFRHLAPGESVEV
ncbi:MBL fold metallo-hydrolase [Arthrobacter wenxiniae]|jgi:L-ascorbate metabolism protein UlaG (beta-lactamase superfamily)|uniref:MBL fold metallo-hydrolase n=1 Tax=Arthrobacter wenxiniae TaxID=2713570 RepID=A0A7Y7IEQ8_9MICC|nr:MBL fold metallo-hydrolase [Arthrobacter wenxiniae]NVM94085.1 MBL fold metallo-hydrolase [Arthrobacter wenxiniae]